MYGLTEVKLTGLARCKAGFKSSGIKRGPLKLPEGVSVNGELIAFGEDEEYLHCVISGTGDIYSVYKKSGESNHIYYELLRLNT